MGADGARPDRGMRPNPIMLQIARIDMPISV